MVTFEDYVKIIEKDTTDIMEALVEGSIYLQENQIDALQTQAAWVVAAKLRRYLEIYLSRHLILLRLMRILIRLYITSCI